MKWKAMCAHCWGYWTELDGENESDAVAPWTEAPPPQPWTVPAASSGAVGKAPPPTLTSAAPAPPPPPKNPPPLTAQAVPGPPVGASSAAGQFQVRVGPPDLLGVKAAANARSSTTDSMGAGSAATSSAGSGTQQAQAPASAEATLMLAILGEVQSVARNVEGLRCEVADVKLKLKQFIRDLNAAGDAQDVAGAPAASSSGPPGLEGFLQPESDEATST